MPMPRGRDRRVLTVVEPTRIARLLAEALLARRAYEDTAEATPVGISPEHILTVAMPVRSHYIRSVGEFPFTLRLRSAG